MKRYQTRRGVVLTEIAGQYVLVAAKEVRSLCPYTAQINETAAVCWRVLETGATVEELTTALMKEYEVEDPTALHEDLEQLIEQLQKSNYLIEVSGTEDNA